MSNPYERIDQLERDVALLQRQNVTLALQQAELARMLALLQSLGESSESLPGEHAPERNARGRTPKPS